MIVKTYIEGNPPGMLFCNPRPSNLLDPATKKLNAFKQAFTKNKNDENQIAYLQAQWHCAQYWEDGRGCYIPRRMIQASLIGAAKKETVPGKKASFKEIVACSVSPVGDAALELPLPHTTEPDIRQLCDNPDYFFVIPAAIGQSMVPIARPLFPKWKATLTFEIFDVASVPASLMKTFMRTMSRRGFGDWRPSSPTPGEYGTFEILKVESSEDGSNWTRI